VLIPAENVTDTNFIPTALKEKLTITPVQRVDQVLEKVLLP
jgi:ATP-dependent Lon protease